MKRFITYLFEYENGSKGKNIGFIRTDIRSGTCRLEVHVHNLNRFQGKGQIFLLVDQGEAVGIPIGEMVVSQGRGDGRMAFLAEPAAGTEYPFAAVVGVGVQFGNQYYAASSWLEESREEFCKGNFRVWQKEAQPAEPETEPPGQETPEAEPETELPGQEASEEKAAAPETIAQELSRSEPYVQQSLEEARSRSVIRISRIDMNGIRKLPKRNWYLCNNSFVIHGYLNYHYLILKEIKEEGIHKHYLGVPGIYEKPERVMALLFGFPEFQPESNLQQICRNEDREPSDEGTFGYWFCLLDM